MISFVRDLFFWRAYTTGQNKAYWKKKTDPEYWKNYIKTWNHPHRQVISAALNTIPWVSLFEVGCGSGPNIVNIVKNFQGKQLGGCDINEMAIRVAKANIHGALLQNGSGDDIMMSDKSTDITLTDMYLIYVDPRHIKKYLMELKRITRNYLVLHEYFAERWWDGWKLRIFSGRHAYNYKKLLEKLGFYDVQIFKMPIIEEDNEQQFRHLILAKNTQTL